MKLQEIVMNGLIDDKEKFTASFKLDGCGCDLRKGHWFEDKMLELAKMDIISMSWSEENGWSFALRRN